MEKSLAKTDQISAKAAAVIATNPATPARRAVSAKRSGEKFPERPPLSPRSQFGPGRPAVASIRKASAPASRLYAASASAIRRERLPKAAIGDSNTILARKLRGEDAYGQGCNQFIINGMCVICLSGLAKGETR